MYGGSFNPLHMGHVDCIIRAANMCEKLYIVLSVGCKRNEIDMRVRYRWLYQITKHIGNVEIFTIEDNDATKADYGVNSWKKDAEYDRLGLEEEYTEYLGNKVVCHSLPIRPGRNLAVICEAAAVNHRQKKMGYNAAQELYRRVQANLTKGQNEEEEE
jgi:cytidyltransferase-like protein